MVLQSEAPGNIFFFFGGGGGWGVGVILDAAETIVG